MDCRHKESACRAGNAARLREEGQEVGGVRAHVGRRQRAQPQEAAGRGRAAGSARRAAQLVLHRPVQAVPVCLRSRACRTQGYRHSIPECR